MNSTGNKARALSYRFLRWCAVKLRTALKVEEEFETEQSLSVSN